MNCLKCKVNLDNEIYVVIPDEGNFCLTCFNEWSESQLDEFVSD